MMQLQNSRDVYDDSLANEHARIDAHFAQLHGQGLIPLPDDKACLERVKQREKEKIETEGKS